MTDRGYVFFMSLRLERPKRAIWIFLFVVTASVAAGLAAGWNFVWARIPSSAAAGMALGMLGFAFLIFNMVLFFMKVLRETRLNHMQSEFLAGVTHELKTPIATLELCSGLLRQEGIDAETSERLWQNHRVELERLKTQVEGLLEAARLEWRKPGLALSMHELESMLSERIERWRQARGDSMVILRKGEPLRVHARIEADAWSRVLDVLVENAAKFSPSGSPIHLETQLLPQPSGQVRWRLEVKDQGFGFDPQEAPRLFDRFYRGKQGSPVRIAGTGLGLFFARRLCRQMGIQITASSPAWAKERYLRSKDRGRHG